MTAPSADLDAIVDATVPKDAAVVRLAPSEVDEGFGRGSPEEAIARAGGVPSTHPERPLVVVVNDPDRATSSAPVLAALRRRTGPRPFRLLVATGSHKWNDAQRAAHEAPLRAAAGEPVEFVWHDGFDEASHAAAGWARLDRRLLEAADIVAVGSVEPHWFAGLTGAHKTLTVGVMLKDDLEKNHRLALDPRSRPLALAGNPVHEGHVAALRHVVSGRRVLAVQHIGSRWVAGDPEETLAECLVAARARWGRSVAAPLDFVVTAIEPPLSRSLYQAEKGVKHGEHVVRDGGALLLVAECEDGVGPSRFVDLLKRAKSEAAARKLLDTEGYKLGDHKAVRLRALTGRGVKLGLLSSTFDEATGKVAGFKVLRDAPSANRWLARSAGKGARGATIADGGHVVPEIGA